MTDHSLLGDLSSEEGRRKKEALSINTLYIMVHKIFHFQKFNEYSIIEHMFQTFCFVNYKDFGYIVV